MSDLLSIILSVVLAISIVVDIATIRSLRRRLKKCHEDHLVESNRTVRRLCMDYGSVIKIAAQRQAQAETEAMGLRAKVAALEATNNKLVAKTACRDVAAAIQAAAQTTSKWK